MKKKLFIAAIIMAISVTAFSGCRMSTDLSVFMEGGRASGSAPEQVGIITRFAGIYLRIGGTGDPGILRLSLIRYFLCFFVGL